MLLGTILYHLGIVCEVDPGQANITSSKRIIGQPVTLYIGETLFFAL